MLSIFDENGNLFGWARYWGTVTASSENDMTGTMNVQYYSADGTPLFPKTFTGTLHRKRVEMIFEH